MEEYQEEVLHEVAINALNNVIKLDDYRAFMPGGVNGPYFDIESPIRNTAHWLIIFSVLWNRTANREFFIAAKKLLCFLTTPGKYQVDDIYVQRQKNGKDWCNGVIGQAWVIEALVISGKLLGNNDALDKAGRSASVFQYDSHVHAWSKRDPSNKKWSIDYTLNHQLWYAAALAMLDDPKHDANILDFLEALHEGGLRTRLDGTIAHLFYTKSTKGMLLRARYFINQYRDIESLQEKETGYHLYNLHPLARLYKKFYEHPVFKSAPILKALSRAFDKDFLRKLEMNKYAYTYNAPGFELPLIAEVFGYELPEEVWDRQVALTFNDSLVSFCKNSDDPLTLNSRTYELLLSYS